MTRTALSVVRLALVLLTTAVVAHGPTALDSDAALTWQPLGAHHLDRFFQPPPFSLAPHVEHMRDQRQRRLEAAAREASARQHERRLSPGTCAIALDKLETDFKDGLKSRWSSLHGILTAPDFDVKKALSELPDLGEKFGKFDFAKLGNSLMDALDVAGSIVDIVSLDADVQEMIGKAKEVIDKIREAEQIVRSIANSMLDRMEVRDFTHFLNAAVSSAKVVFDNNSTRSDERFAVCRAFDYSKITELSSSMQNYQLCTNATDTTAHNKCQLTVGLAATSAVMQSLTAAAICDAHFVIAQTHSSRPLSSLKLDAQNLVKDVMSTIIISHKNDTEFTDAKTALDKYTTDIESLGSKAAPVDDPDSPDAFVKNVLADLYGRTLTTAAAIGNYTSSSLYRNMTATNPDAGAAGQLVGLAAAKSQKEVKDKLVNLGNKVVSQHNERMGMYDTINATLWNNHNEFMGQVDKMSTQFTEQHSERMGRLQNVQQNLGDVQSATVNGFGQLRGKIQDMGRRWVSQVQTIENNAIAVGAETTTYLSNAVMDATREVENRINGVGETLLRNHAQVMNAISSAEDSATNEFMATQNFLQSSSNRLAQAIDGGLSNLEDAASRTFTKVNDVVAKRMEESYTVLDGIMAGMSSNFSLIDGRLIVLQDRAANMSRQLDIAKQFLKDIHFKFDVVQQMLDDLPVVVQRELFQSEVDGLHRQYMNMRKAYRTYLDSDLPVKSLIESCVSYQVYDLFLRFLRLVDVSDEELPDYLANFEYDLGRYESFGVTVIGALNELSFLDGVCAKVQFSATIKDVEVKAKEQAELILRASSNLAYQVEEVIPAYVLANRIQSRLDSVSSLAWEVAGAATAESLREELQHGLSDFAYVTVIHAGIDGELLVDHLDREVTLDARDKSRTSGIVVSPDRKVAVVWSHTKVLADAALASANATELLRQGVYRGNVTSTSSSCFIASTPEYYPHCSGCSCLHYEDFASETDAMAGRAVTYLSDKSYDADFLVESVKSAGVDYTLHFIQLNIGSLAGSTATAQLSADVVSVLDAATTGVPPDPLLWEGLTTSGRFDVVPSGIRGTLIRENEVVLTLSQGPAKYRLPFSLFCDGQVKMIKRAEPELELRYMCEQTPRASSPPDITTAGYPIATAGLPTKRLARAVCSRDATRQFCKARGATELSRHRAAVNGTTSQPVFRFGDDVPDVTLFTDAGFHGMVAICRQCSPDELDVLSKRYPFTTAVIGIPDAPAEMLQIECAEPTTVAGRAMQLVICRPLQPSQ